MNRDQSSREDALKRIDAQMPLSIKISKSDITVDNCGTANDLHEKAINIVIPQIVTMLGKKREEKYREMKD